MEFTAREKKIAKTYRIIAYISIPILLILGVIFTYVTDFERSFPLGILLLFGGIFLLCLTTLIKHFINPKDDTPTTYRVYRRTRSVLFVIIIFFYAGSRVLVSLSDIALGTKETVLTEAKVKTIKEGLYGSTNVTYLIGKTQSGETIKIRIREYETESKTRTLLKTSDEVIVSYYKSLKTLYDIKAKD